MIEDTSFSLLGGKWKEEKVPDTKGVLSFEERIEENSA